MELHRDAGERRRARERCDRADALVDGAPDIAVAEHGTWVDRYRAEPDVD